MEVTVEAVVMVEEVGGAEGDEVVPEVLEDLVVPEVL